MLPKTKEQWYFYHKHKNYKVILGAVKVGLPYAAKMSSLCLLYSGLEATFDFVRKENDIINSFMAGAMSGMVVSGICKYKLFLNFGEEALLSVLNVDLFPDFTDFNCFLNIY